MCDSKSCDVWSTGTVFRAWLIGGKLVTRVCKAIGPKHHLKAISRGRG